MIPRHLLIGVAALLGLVVAMGVYLGQVRRQAREMAAPVASSGSVAPPTSGPTETVTLYVADDISGTLRARTAQIPCPGDVSKEPKSYCARYFVSTSNLARVINFRRREISAAFT